MKKIFVILFIVLFNFQGIAQSKNELQILAAMNEQVAAWNAGDMSRYMNTYWHNDSLMFIGSRIELGWDNILKNYKRAYPDTASMGKLDFEIISLKRLSVFYYSVVGKWHLKRTAGDQKGAFTLLFKKVKNRWVIIQDHSS